MFHSDDRADVRVQLGNSNQIQFSLFNEKNHLGSGYCICTDLSASGAHFFTDIQLILNQELCLTVLRNGYCVERVHVSVVRADSALNDEERFCGAVIFKQPLQHLTEILLQMQKDSSSIAA